MTPPEGAGIARRDLLLILSEELSDLAASAASLQTALGEVLAHATASGGTFDSIWQMQELDRLQQSAADLAAVVRQAAEDEGQRIDVERLAAATRLGGLRERLRGSARNASCQQEPGIVAMF